MGIRDAWDYFWFGPRQPAAPAPPPAPETRAPRPMATPSGLGIVGGRLSRDKDAPQFASPWATILPPDDWERHWTTYRLDARQLETLPPAKLLQILVDLSPDASRALWDWLRMCNPGWECKVYRPEPRMVAGRRGDVTEDVPDERGQAVVDAFNARLADLYGSVDVVLSRLFINAALRGSMLSELVMDAAGREGVDFAIPDVASVRFRRRDDPERGVVWEMGQLQGGKFVALDRPTIRYLPIDPMPDSPYGRPLFSSALFVVLFSLGMLSDLRRVIQQQGYPRFDVTILTEMAKSMLSPADQADPARVAAFMDHIIGKLETKLASLGPDDMFVHNDAVVMGKSSGTLDASSLSASDGLFKQLGGMGVRAFKTMPLVMGITDGVSEANANRQWEMFAAGIKSAQHMAETMLERQYGLLLQAQGIQARVQFRFAELRAAELLRDAQTEALVIANAAEKRNQGFITQDEASNEVVGKDAAADGPVGGVAGDSQEADDAQDVETEPGGNRHAPANGHARRDPALASLAAAYGLNGRDA